jgi:hypothetical protein
MPDREDPSYGAPATIRPFGYRRSLFTDGETRHALKQVEQTGKQLSLVDGERDAIYWTSLRSETVLLSHYDPGREFETLLMSKLVSPEGRPKTERHDVSRGIIKSLVFRR